VGDAPDFLLLGKMRGGKRGAVTGKPIKVPMRLENSHQDRQKYEGRSSVQKRKHQVDDEEGVVESRSAEVEVREKIREFC